LIEAAGDPGDHGRRHEHRGQNDCDCDDWSRHLLHGWAISLRLRALSGEVLQVSEGSLYPALHKLEQEGWIKAEWKQTENNRRAKFYALTRLGRKELESEKANWQRLSSAISHLVQLSEA